MNELHLGDCLEVLKTLEAESIDALVTDPPAGLGFMGREWDTFRTRVRSAGFTFKDGHRWPGISEGQEYSRKTRENFIAFMTTVAEECYRVMKPGAHGLVWAIPRTSHWTGMALEDAGFEIRDSVTHLFGQGFPKSLDVSKAIDKMAGAEREVVRARTYALRNDGGYSGGLNTTLPRSESAEITAPATEAAKQWQGWGTGLKPSRRKVDSRS